MAFFNFYLCIYLRITMEYTSVYVIKNKYIHKRLLPYSIYILLISDETGHELRLYQWKDKDGIDRI